jgi:hypothetical protein
LISVAPKVGAIFGAGALSQSGILANYNGKVGELWSFVSSTSLADPDHKVLGKQVPQQYVATTENSSEAAFVGDLKGESGNFYLVRKNAAAKLAGKVYPDTLRYISQPKAIAYLRAANSDFPRLSVYLLESDLSADISDYVNEYRGVPWPSPGILYATSGGDDDGLWFAKAR